MKTGNFARRSIASSAVGFKVTDDDWLISITDKKGKDLVTYLPFEHILFMKFDDTSDRDGNEISDTDALMIAEFIKSARQHHKNVWVNCHAGICRSGAIVTLLIELGWEDAKCFLSPGRIPNHLVYNKVRIHFPEVRHSWDPEPGATIVKAR